MLGGMGLDLKMLAMVSIHIFHSIWLGGCTSPFYPANLMKRSLVQVYESDVRFSTQKQKGGGGWGVVEIGHWWVVTLISEIRGCT